MKKMLATAALTVAGAAVTSAQAATPFNEDQQRVLNTIVEMNEAFGAQDLDGIMRAYENVASVAFQPGVVSAGDDQLRAGFQQFFAVDPDFEFAGHEVIISGDIALHITPWEMTGTAPDGEPMAQSGLSVAVLRRQADGGWRMVIDNPFGAALLQDK